MYYYSAKLKMADIENGATTTIAVEAVQEKQVPVAAGEKRKSEGGMESPAKAKLLKTDEAEVTKESSAEEDQSNGKEAEETKEETETKVESDEKKPLESEETEKSEGEF